MPFVLSGLEEPILEKRRRERGNRRLHELHFKWRSALAAGDTVGALTAALDYDVLAAEIYGKDYLDDLQSDLESEPANDA
jgi:hypothetical protein